MDENILFSYELKDAWFLPITGVDVYKTGYNSQIKIFSWKSGQ